ncbi:hypothetical protein Tsubulata_006873 [Turnera subulata]|uniref:F-box domain-containing protein n=1 Tax=Turnera subulata TaxID=218843 RepID=A0A9Q0GAX1_9ROSI|nr:hypothetical protein Tsubulata_006873 [Turnera subulata]
MAATNLRLPSETVEAILAMLPNESLHRFRSVSKSWSSLLLSEEFQKLRFKSAPPELNVQKLLRLRSRPLRYYEDDYKDDEDDCEDDEGDYKDDQDDCEDDEDDYKDDEDDYVIESCDYRGDEETCTEVFFPERGSCLIFIGSCNGLVCLALESPRNDYRDIFVWNPLTGVYRKLPDPEGMARGYDFWRAYGFGYDSVADDYKVFLAVRYWDDPTPKPRAPLVQIFSLKTGSWKSVENPNRHLRGLREGDRGVFLNGALHWRKEYDAKITAFDLVEEKFGDVPAPSHPQEVLLEHNGIGIVGEYLCMSWIPTPSDDRIVWVMKEYLNKESWVPFIDYGPSWRDQCSVRYHCNFIADSVEDEEHGGCLMFYLHGRGPSTRILKWDKSLEKSDRDGVVRVKSYEHLASIPYREALTSPYPSSGRDEQGF